MYIKVRAKTGAKNESVHRVSAEHFEISVREKPKNNLANHRTIALIAAELGVAPAKIRIVKGHRSPSKTLSIGLK